MFKKNIKRKKKMKKKIIVLLIVFMLCIYNCGKDSSVIKWTRQSFCCKKAVSRGKNYYKGRSRIPKDLVTFPGYDIRYNEIYIHKNIVKYEVGDTIKVIFVK